MLGENEFRLRQGFHLRRKRLVRRKSGAPRCGAPSFSGIYFVNTTHGKALFLGLFLLLYPVYTQFVPNVADHFFCQRFPHKNTGFQAKIRCFLFADHTYDRAFEIIDVYRRMYLYLFGDR